VIQAPKLEPRIMQYKLTDYEWTTMKLMLPNKPRGVPRVAIGLHRKFDPAGKTSTIPSEISFARGRAHDRKLHPI